MTLTTITAYWKRPQMLQTWVRCLKAAAHPEVQHLIYFVGEPVPPWWDLEVKESRILALRQWEAPGFSIGHYHNLGAQQANTEWIMKLDVDTLPHTGYFAELVPLLQKAKPKQWFNAGMFYLNQHYSQAFFGNHGVLSPATFQAIMSYPRTYSASSYLAPAATNFVCRRGVYLHLGGCDERFRGYGWEDYQQIYMLEKFERGGAEPLPGAVDIKNVTQRCRDEISRPKARQLWDANRWLCLIHHWHNRSDTPYYHSMASNRQVLFEWVRPPCPAKP